MKIAWSWIGNVKDQVYNTSGLCVVPQLCTIYYISKKYTIFI